MSVSDPNSQSTTATVSANGWLEAVWYPIGRFPILLSTAIIDGTADVGSITVNGTTKNPGQIIWMGSGTTSIIGNPPSGYVFDHWEIDHVNVASQSSQSTTAYATGIGTLKAWFILPQPSGYSITIQITGLPAGITTKIYIDGSMITESGSGSIQLSVSEGSHTILVDPYVYLDSGTRYHCPSYSQGVSSTTTITFTYHTEYYLTVNTDPNSLESISGSDWYDSGASVTTGAAPSSVTSQSKTYTFSTWKVDGSSVSGNPISINMNAPHTATAVYTTENELIAPSGLSATAVSSSRIDLSWTDNSGDESDFHIERKTGSGGTWSEIDTVSANTVSYQDTGLSAGTAYYYRVRAHRHSDGAYSSYSNEPSATTSSGDTEISELTLFTDSDNIGLEDTLNVGIQIKVTGDLSMSIAAQLLGLFWGQSITITYEIELRQDIPWFPDKSLGSLTFSRTITWSQWSGQSRITLEDGQEISPTTTDEVKTLLFSATKFISIKGKEFGWIFHEGSHQIFAKVRVSWTALGQWGAGSRQKESERKTIVVSGTSVNSGNTVFLYETGERLYLHVYDAEGHHTGRDYTTNQTEIGIPGSSYEEYSEGICIILPENVTSFSYIVDAQYATQPQENYTVFLGSVKEGQMVQMTSRNMTIQKDEEQEGKVKVMQNEISLGINSLPRIIWFDIPTQVYQNEMLIAKINVSDQEGLGQVNFVLLEDIGRINYIGQLNSNIYEFRINMSAYTPGAYNCYITAEDTDGAVVTTSTKVLQIDGILKLESAFSHDILSSGENTTLIATLRDYFNNFVTNAIINVTIAGQTFLLTDQGDGTYQAIIKTNELPSPQGLGENFVANIIAEKQYYDTAGQQLNLYIRPWWWPYLPYLIGVPLVLALLTMSVLLLRRSRRVVVKAPEEGLIMASPEVIQALKSAKVSFDKGSYAPAVVSASEKLRSELINQLRLRQSCTNEEIAETLNRTNMDINRNEVISILKLADKCKFDEYLPTQNEARESLEKASNILKKLEKTKKT